MALYDDASLILLASGAAGKETDDASKIYSVKPTNGNGDLSISRGDNLNATRVGPTGLIEKGRENLFRNTVFAGAGLDTEPTGGSKFIDSTGGTFNVTSTAGQLRFITASDERAFIQSHSVTTASLYSFSVFVDEVVTTLPVNKVISDSGEATDIRYEEDGVQISTSTNVQAGKRYTMVVNKTNTNSTRFRIGSGTANQVAGDVTLSKPQLEVGIVATDYIENTSTSGSATAGIKEDEPRFDYPLAGGAPSLLLEPERRNHVKHSEYGGGYEVVDSNVTVTNNAEVSPEGVKNGVKIEGISTSSATQAVKFGALESGSVVGRTFTGSLYIKPVNSGDVGGNVYLSIQRRNGDFEGSTETIQIDSADWKRYKITYTFTGAASGNQTGCDFKILKTGTPIDDIYVYGVQLEEGASATSYIPTHGTAATRSADTIADLTSIPSVNTSTYTFFAHVSQANTGGTGNRGPRMKNASNDALMGYFINNSEQKQFFLDPDSAGSGSNRTFSTTDISPVSSTQLAGDEVKYAFVINGTSVKCFVDGNTLFSGTASGVVTANRIIFGTSDGAPDHIKSVIYFPSAISNIDALVLTDTNYGSYSEMVNSLSYTQHG
jgi:hypothetical protein